MLETMSKNNIIAINNSWSNRNNYNKEYNKDIINHLQIAKNYIF